MRITRVKLGKGEDPPVCTDVYEGCPVIAGYMFDALIARDLGIETPRQVNECIRAHMTIRDVYDCYTYNEPNLTHYYELTNG